MWNYVPFEEAVEICDTQRKPINNKDRARRIEGKKKDSLYPYYGATGQVGYIDDYITDGEYVLLGEDGAPFLNTFAKKAYIISGKTWVNNHAHVLKSKTNNKFLCYYLNYFNYSGYVSGTTRLKLTQGQMKHIKIPDVSIEEQNRIVSRIEELFSELDKGVETLQIIKEQLAVYRQAVLKRAFEGKFTEQWRSEHPEIENSFQTLLDSILSDGHKEKYESEKNIKLSKLPNLWKWIRIGDISNGPEYGTSKKSEKEGKIPVIRMGNLQKGIIDWEDLVYTSDDDEIIKYQLKAGDVLFNRTNSPELVGKTSIYRGEREAVFAGYLIRINQADFIDSEYLTYYMNSFTAKQYGNNVKTDGVNQSNINGKKLCSYPFPLCSVEEQKQVVYELESRLTVCDNIDKMVDTTLAQAEAMRQSILKKAFEGGLN